jgi:hypothetical protein
MKDTKTKTPVFERAQAVADSVRDFINKHKPPECDCPVDEIFRHFSAGELATVEKVMLILIANCGFELARHENNPLEVQILVLEQAAFQAVVSHVLDEQKRRQNETWTEEFE